LFAKIENNRFVEFKYFSSDTPVSTSYVKYIGPLLEFAPSKTVDETDKLIDQLNNIINKLKL